MYIELLRTLRVTKQVLVAAASNLHASSIEQGIEMEKFLRELILLTVLGLVLFAGVNISGAVVRAINPQPSPEPSAVYIQPKDSSQDPYAQGNAPVGGGPNVGPGQYIAPEDIQPLPKDPYVAPAPPTQGSEDIYFPSEPGSSEPNSPAP